MQRIWLLRLLLPIRFSRLLSGLQISIILLILFLWGTDNSAHTQGAPYLFFSAIIGYSIAMFSYITDKCREALIELQPTLQLSDEEFDEQLGRIGYCRPYEAVLALLIGLAGGIPHIILLSDSVSGLFEDFLTDIHTFTAFTGTLMVWVVVATMSYFLVRYAIMFARLGKHSVEIDILNNKPLVPFSHVATLLSLSLIGSMALFPLMFLEQTSIFVSMVPGLISLGIPMIALFIIPIWPVHKRMTAEKERELSGINRRIADVRQGQSLEVLDDATFAQLNPLLLSRREVLSAPVWPFDAGSLTQITLYLVIVPLTWAGAALLEMAMESFL
ncbi:MAG: hypothetical protein ABJ056_03425 [Halioglobus sp.]